MTALDEVTDIIRYTVEPIFGDGAGFRIDPQGDWVRFEDVAPEIAQLRHDLSRSMANHVADINPPLSSKQIADVLEFLRAFIAGGSLQDFKPWAGELYQKLYRAADETGAEPMVMPSGPWEQRWHGSGTDRGDHIFQNGERIAYLGDQHHDAVTRLVYEHNCAVARSAAETKADSSLVLRICTAYEQGLGQAGRDLSNPYRAPSPESEAWNIGIQHGLRMFIGDTSPSKARVPLGDEDLPNDTSWDKP
jgi:hypothetical protein